MSQTIGTKKVVLMAIWEIDGFHVASVMPPGGRFNTEYFPPHIMDPLLAKVFPKGRKTMHFD
jgi:hypothetical protein